MSMYIPLEGFDMKKLLPLLGLLAAIFGLACIAGFVVTVLNTGSAQVFSAGSDFGAIATALRMDIENGLAIMIG